MKALCYRAWQSAGVILTGGCGVLRRACRLVRLLRFGLLRFFRSGAYSSDVSIALQAWLFARFFARRLRLWVVR